MKYTKKQQMGQEGSAPASFPKNLFRGKRGTVAVMVAICAPALLMAVGLGIEASGWTAITQRLQRTADMAALAGAYASYAGASAQLSANQAAYTAEINGATGVSSTTTPSTRTWSPQTLPTPSVLTDNLIKIQKIPGIKSTSDVAFSATIKDTVPLFFSGEFLSGPNITLSATATAEVTPSAPDCVLALDTSNATGATTAGIDLSNGATVNLNQCGIWVNASGADALYLTGGVTLKAQSVSVVGGDSVTGGSTMTVSGATINGVQVQTFTSPGLPGIGSCSTYPNNATFNTNTASPQPGTYCNGMTISYGTVNLPAGVYVINGGTFNPAGGSTVTGVGVTIVLTGSPGNIATANIANNVNLTLTAPTSGQYAGVAIMQAAGSGIGTSTVAGGANMNITGSMIFPNSLVQFSNGSSNSAACTHLIAFQIQFTGGASFGNSCAGTGTASLGPQGGVSLVE
jgi:Flp pilus assembly protein TadG